MPLLVASRERIRPVHFGFIQGWLIRRLFEVWMLFTLESLLGRLHPLSYPCTAPGPQDLQYLVGTLGGSTPSADPLRLFHQGRST